MSKDNSYFSVPRGGAGNLRNNMHSPIVLPPLNGQDLEKKLRERLVSLPTDKHWNNPNALRFDGSFTPAQIKTRSIPAAPKLEPLVSLFHKWLP